MTTSLDMSLSEALALEQSLQLGLQRTSLPKTAFSSALSAHPPQQQTLSLISLASERILLSDSNTRSFDAPLQLIPPEDFRTPMPNALRTHFMRVAVHQKQGDSTWATFCHSIKIRMDKAQMRLHPFDLHRIQPYLKQVGYTSGSYEHWYLKQTSTRLASDDEILDWDNWQLASKTEQGDFLQHHRALDPKQTRTALEAVFAEATAAHRLVYTEALQTGLSKNDQPFLESLLQDRSKKVVERAETLLAHFPGSVAAQKHQQSLKSLLSASLLRGKINIKKQKGKKAFELRYQVMALTGQMHIDDIATLLEIKPAELPDKIDPKLALPFAQSAAIAQDYKLLSALLHQEKAGHLLSEIDLITDLVKEAPLAIKQGLLTLIMAPLSAAKSLIPETLCSLYHLTESPLPEILATDLLDSKAFKSSYKHVMSLKNPDQSPAMNAIALMATLIPPSLHSAYRYATRDLPFNMSHDPKPYLDFITQLDTFDAKENHYD